MAERLLSAEDLEEVLKDDKTTDLDDTLSDALEKAMGAEDSQAKPDGEDTEEAGAEEAAAADEAPSEKDDETTPDEGEEAKADSETEEAKPESEDEGEETKPDDKAEALEPPVHWKRVRKEAFKSLAEDQQRAVLDFHKEMEADVTRKSQEISDFRKAAEPILEAVKPFEAYIESLGTTPSEAFKYLMGAEYVLRNGTPEQKTQQLARLAKSYEIDIDALETEDTEPEPADPRVAKLEKDHSETRTKLTEYEERERERLREEQQREVDAFAQAKDDQGNLRRPYFDDVREAMGAIMEATGETDLETLYDKAIWADPDIRKQLLTDQTRQTEETRKAEEAKRAEQVKRERAEKAKKARLAAQGVGGSAEPSGAAANPPSDSLMGELERQMARAEAASE